MSRLKNDVAYTARLYWLPKWLSEGKKWR